MRDALVQVKKSVGKSDKKSGKKSDKKILDHLKDYPTATLEELQGLTGLSSGGIRKAIRRLKDAKLLRRIGPDKGGHWEVLNGSFRGSGTIGGLRAVEKPSKLS